MNYSIFLVCLLLVANGLFGQVVHTSDTSKIKVSETFWATEDKVYVDSVQMEFSKTFLDTNNIAEIVYFKENPQSLHKSRGVTLITRKKKVDFIGIGDLLNSLNLSDSSTIKFIVDDILVTDTSNLRFEPLTIEKLDILKRSSDKVDHGFERSVHVLVTTQWRKIRR